MSQPIRNAKIQGLVGGAPKISSKPLTQAQSVDFAGLLGKEQIKISGHAQTRLQSRGIELAQEHWQRIHEGVDRAAQKGSRESLVLMDDVALIVSVKNRTVITAVAKEQLRENVFTNIDSAVIV